MLSSPDGETLRVTAHRSFVLEESIDQLSCVGVPWRRKALRVQFLDEVAVDAGGLHREWFTLLSQLVADTRRGLFICHDASSQTYHINPNSHADCGDEHITYFFTIGRIVGRALLEGIPWGFHFTLPLLKVLLGRPVGLQDVEAVDPVLHRNLDWLLRNDGVESLGLDFSVTLHTDSDSTPRTVDLIAEGSRIAVTDENKRVYVERRARFLLVESVSEQLHAFLTGFYEVVPMELLFLFDPEEFDFLLSGLRRD
ncbi:hypothetical protein PINS_up015577 [Pythium insidiosum]|nr:hypothetical protein PINS_up015577 [Pythium insidiosum]